MGNLQLNVGNFVVVEHSHVDVSFENRFETFVAMKIHIVAVLIILDWGPVPHFAPWRHCNQCG
jgi:hypothetical protein